MLSNDPIVQCRTCSRVLWHDISGKGLKMQGRWRLITSWLSFHDMCIQYATPAAARGVAPPDAYYVADSRQHRCTAFHAAEGLFATILTSGHAVTDQRPR